MPSLSNAVIPAISLVSPPLSFASTTPVRAFVTPSTSFESDYFSEKIEGLLKRDNSRYVVVENTNKKLTSSCWKTFDFTGLIAMWRDIFQLSRGALSEKLNSRKLAEAHGF